MPNWDDITRNVKTHGDFAGREEIEQDAYFAFFAGRADPLHQSTSLILSKVLNRLTKVCTKAGLRWPLVGVALLKATSRN